MASTNASSAVELSRSTPYGTAVDISDNPTPRTPAAVSASEPLEISSSSPAYNVADSSDNDDGIEPRACGGDSTGGDAASAEENDPFVTSSKENSEASSSHGSTSEPTPYRPRADREGLDITPELAQAIFSADACVFVANLVASKPDDVICDAVHDAFSSFGTCYVKVKRDSQQMPYAFCQYERVEDSNRAIVSGRHLTILGRPCRTERAKVNRSLYLSRTTGGSITEEEAREILRERGDIQSVWFSTPTDIEMFRLPQGVWVQFAFFQDARDAATAFKESTEFRLEQPQLPEDLRAKLGSGRVQATPSKTPGRQTGPCSTPSSRMSFVTESNSIFVGNLHTGVTLDQLRTIFGKFGSLRNLEMVCRPSLPGNSVHAFVEFDSPRAADRAMNAEHVLGNMHLRVERRQSTPFALSRSSSRLSSESPRRRSYASSNGTMPRTPFSGFSGPAYHHEYGHHGQMGGDMTYPIPSSIPMTMQPYFPAQYAPPAQPNSAPHQTSGHPLVYGSPHSGQYNGDGGFGHFGYPSVAPPHFSLPPAPQLPLVSPTHESKNNGLPPVPEH